MNTPFIACLGPSRPIAVFSFPRRLTSALVAVLLCHAGFAQGLTDQQAYEARITNQGEAQRAGIPRVFDNHPTPRDGDYSYLIYDRAVPVPRMPPGLGDPFADQSSERVPGSQQGELAREPFFGPYVALALSNRLSEKVAARVATFRASRDALVRDLSTKLVESRELSPTDRNAVAAELGRAYESRVVQLAREAEAIRSDLDGVDAEYRFRGEYPARGLVGGVTTTQALRLIKARYHYAGLSDEQRQLLLEIAYNTVVWARDPSEADHRGTELYFWPATSRIRLPATLPEALEAKVTTFAREKERLKDELRTAVLREENQWGFRRAQRLADLAAEQAPGFRTLEKLAEEIRVELASHAPPPRQPEDTTLPPDLTRRVGEFTARKAAVQRDLASQLRQLRAEHPRERFVVQRLENSLAIMQAERGQKVDLSEVNASFAERYASLGREADAIRRDLETYTRANPSVGSANVERVAAQFAKAYHARELQTRYRDYHRAVLEPGLSPAQRVVLFQAAVEELDKAGWVPRP